jgi:hypothetical protein
MSDLPATANCLNPKINPGYSVVVGGDSTWYVDARHRLYSLTVRRLWSPATPILKGAVTEAESRAQRWN